MDITQLTVKTAVILQLFGKLQSIYNQTVTLFFFNIIGLRHVFTIYSKLHISECKLTEGGFTGGEALKKI